MPHAIVAIFKDAYKVLARYKTRHEAIADILNRSVRSHGVVYRDGTTGKRYCINECRMMKGI